MLLILASCRSAKYLDADQSLVTKIELDGIPKEFKEQAYQYISNEIRPNSPLNLTIYNIVNTKKGRYKTEKTRQVGEPPRILDSSLVDLSNTQIQRFLQTKGYFRAEVTPQIETVRKKSKIIFRADVGEPFVIQDIRYEYEDRHIGQVYEQHVKPRSLIVAGEQYDYQKLLREREKLYQEAKNQGYYDYLRQYMRIGIDTNAFGNRADLNISILQSDSLDQEVYTINDVFLRIRKSAAVGNSNLEFVRDTASGIYYADETGRFRLSPIRRYMYLRPEHKYRLTDENISYDRLYDMNSFRNVKINYEEEEGNLLNVYYELIPRATMSNQIEGEYTFSSGMSGFNLGNTFSHRNVFGGSELLELKLQYGMLFDPRLDGSLSRRIFNNDMQVGVNLVFPRLMVPFRTAEVGVYGLPRTTFSSNAQLFQQYRTYSNRYFTNTLNYSWWQSTYLQHSLTPLVLEYRLGRFDTDFAQSLIDEGYGLYVESNDREYFGLGAQYAITWNAPKLSRLESFSYIRGSVDLSGNVLGLLSGVFNFDKNANGEKLLFKVPYLQYIKGEVDYRRYIHLGGHKQFVFRFNGGVAVPYGNNSKLLIFEKSFFAGGMNGIRAWQARTLGPGNYNREVLPEDLRINLRNLDQLGEIKLEANLEYRFRLMNSFLGAKLNGATFVDMGNVWRLRADQLNPNGEFQFDKLLGQIAIGTGFGLRFDMDYFILRMDAGVKVKDPQFKGSQQWVLKHMFGSRDFKNQYYELHKPDRYNFIQYNFGVGLPF